MKISLLPKSRTGQLALIIFVISLIFFSIGTNLPESYKNPDLPDIVNKPLFALLMYSGILSSIAAAFFGLKSIIKKKERAILTYLTIPMGLIFFIGIVGMIIALIVQKILGII
jgi:sensor histidine kinase YesM